MKKRSLRSSVITSIFLSLIAVTFVLPLVWMILASLKGSEEVFSHNWLPSIARWSNYRIVWTDSQIPLGRSYVNSLIIVLLGTFGQVAFSSMAAYAFAKVCFKGKGAIFALFLSSMMIPSQVTIIPRFMLFYRLNLYNTLWAIILPAWFGPTAIFLLRQFYLGLPNDLMEAAQIDGAGHFSIFGRILLPLTKPAIVSVTVLSFIALWNEYLTPLIFLTNKKMFTIAQAIRFWLFDDAQRYELTMAAATSAIIPVIFIFIAGQKYFVEGIATTGVKG